MYKAFISLLLVAGVSAAVVKPPSCPVGYFGNIADPDRCDTFYFCANGLQINLFCANGFEFDDNLKDCVQISAGGCTLGTADPPKSAESAESLKSAELAELICPIGFFGNIAHPELCSSFFMCVGIGAPILLNCAEGLEFNSESNDCIRISTGGCTLGTAEAPKSAESYKSAESAEFHESAELAALICPIGFFGNIAHPKLCSSFFMCVGVGAPILLNCAEGLEFDSGSNVCVEITEGGCTLGSPTEIVDTNPNQAADPFSCPKEFFGSVSDPENCTSFYLCKGGLAIHLDCMAGFEFDDDLKVCAEINENGCTSRL